MTADGIKPLKVGQTVYVRNEELGGTEIIKCKIYKSHYGEVDPEDNEAYPYDDYDLVDESGLPINEFVSRDDIYTSFRAAKED